MKLSLSFLLVLTGLSLQDVVKYNSKHIKETPAPEDRVPESTLKRRTRTRGFLQPAGALRQKGRAQASTNLKWVKWRGSLPYGSVAIYNSYEGRTDYICHHGCYAGFYNPDKGPYCYYPYGGKEMRYHYFAILVNEGKLENLMWKDGSYGSVPQNSVITCSWENIYVGKNKYGLGKVQGEAFFLPWGGSEYWYKHYQVLTYDTDILTEQISNVIYDTNQATILNYPPEAMSKSSITNSECGPVVKTVTLQKTHQVEKRWDTKSATKIGVQTSITAKIPFIGSFQIDFSVETTIESSWGTTVVDKKWYTSTVAVTVPPNHSCSVHMVGYKNRADIPYTALLTRKYLSGKTTSAYIIGTYKGVDIVDVRIIVDRCTPIPNAASCP